MIIATAFSKNLKVIKMFTFNYVLNCSRAKSREDNEYEKIQYFMFRCAKIVIIYVVCPFNQNDTAICSADLTQC